MTNMPGGLDTNHSIPVPSHVGGSSDSLRYHASFPDTTHIVPAPASQRDLTTSLLHHAPGSYPGALYQTPFYSALGILEIIHNCSVMHNIDSSPILAGIDSLNVYHAVLIPEGTFADSTLQVGHSLPAKKRRRRRKPPRATLHVTSETDLDVTQASHLAPSDFATQAPQISPTDFVLPPAKPRAIKVSNSFASLSSDSDSDLEDAIPATENARTIAARTSAHTIAAVFGPTTQEDPIMPASVETPARDEVVDTFRPITITKPTVKVDENMPSAPFCRGKGKSSASCDELVVTSGSNRWRGSKPRKWLPVFDTHDNRLLEPHSVHESTYLAKRPKQAQYSPGLAYRTQTRFDAVDVAGTFLPWDATVVGALHGKWLLVSDPSSHS